MVGEARHASLTVGKRSSGARRPDALLLHGVSKTWLRTDRPLLDRVELVVNRGEAVAVSGRNGAGKTTLLRIAAGLIAPDSGTVAAGGYDPEHERGEFQRRIGLLAAGNTGLYARLSVEHHLDLWCRLALVPRNRRGDATSRALAAFGLEPLCGRRVDRLSMGERQRLRLAGAFVHEPSVLLLDEPETSLDSDGTALLRAALDDLLAAGGAAVICLPTGSDSGLAADRRFVLEHGRLAPA